jgi:adenosine deaminase
MTDGQTFSHHGEPHHQFFKEVLQLVDKVCAAYPHHSRLVHFMSFPVMVPTAASYATVETDAAFTWAVV